MDEIISQNRSNRSVWMVAAVAVILFVAVLFVAGILGTPEIASVAQN